MELLAGIYPFFFLLSLLGLVGWFYFQGSNFSGLMSKMFVTGFLVYILALALAPGSTGFKLIILSRDFVLMAVVVTVFQLLSRQKVLYFGALAVFLSIFFSVLFQRWDQTFKWVPPSAELSESYELIIKLSSAYDESQLGVLKRRFDLDCRNISLPESAEGYSRNIIVCDVPESRTTQLDQIAFLLRMNPGVEWWEWNNLISVTPEPAEPLPHQYREGTLSDDPLLGEMWHFSALEYDLLHNLLAENGHLLQHQSLLAILDTGIDAGHEDLASSYHSINSEYDSDPMGHGTHCAGIAAATSNNQLGIASQSHDNSHYRVTSIRVLNERGFGSKKGIIKGIFEAAESGADVISLSLGGPSRGGSDQAYEKAVNFARDKGAIVVAAAGNAGQPARNFSPANVRGVICVGAIGPDLKPAPFSNTPKGIEQFVYAPGVSIFSTLPGDNYQPFNGTSMATPLVASTIALMKSFHPDLTTEQAFEIINRNGMPIPGDGNQQSTLMPYRALADLLKD